MEFQIFGKGSKKAADEVWMARYLLLRLTEKYGVDIEFHCKPLGDTDWNGSGMHCNFSTSYMREVGGKDYFERLMAAFAGACADHIAVYGPDNHMRLTGKHETQAIDQFPTALPIAAHRSACRTASSTTATRAISRIAARIRKATPTDASQVLKTIASVPTERQAAA